MIRATTTVQVSAASAAEALPGRLEIGRTVLHVSPKGTDREPYRFACRWSRGELRGTAAVEIKSLSKTRAEVAVTLEPRSPLDRLIAWGLRRTAGQLAGALRYEIETRTAEEADAFAVRRTTASRVRQRSA